MYRMHKAPQRWVIPACAVIIQPHPALLTLAGVFEAGWCAAAGVARRCNIPRRFRCGPLTVIAASLCAQDLRNIIQMTNILNYGRNAHNSIPRHSLFVYFKRIQHSLKDCGRLRIYIIVMEGQGKSLIAHDK